MTDRGQSGESYQEAIDVLTAAIEPLDAPDKGIGYSWGLRRGQAGYAEAVTARNRLRYLRDSLLKYHQRGES
jgi:hypothetical protein